jgi:D-lactate dehydrogenase (cytochrome)
MSTRRHGGVTLDLSRMNAILAVHPEDLDCAIQPGVTRKQLNEHLRDQGLFFPIDPGADASLGGMAATRASGTNAVRYGTMKDNVLALEAVLADGRIIRTARAPRSLGRLRPHPPLRGFGGHARRHHRAHPQAARHPRGDVLRHLLLPFRGGRLRRRHPDDPDGHPGRADGASRRPHGAAVNAYSKLTLPETPLLLLEFHGSTAGVAEQAETFGQIAADTGGTGFAWTTSPEERTRLWQARHDAYWATIALRPGREGARHRRLRPDLAPRGMRRGRAPGRTNSAFSPRSSAMWATATSTSPRSSTSPTRTRSRGTEGLVAWLAELAISMDGTCTGEHGIGQGKRRLSPQGTGRGGGRHGRDQGRARPAGHHEPGQDRLTLTRRRVQRLEGDRRQRARDAGDVEQVLAQVAPDVLVLRGCRSSRGGRSPRSSNRVPTRSRAGRSPARRRRSSRAGSEAGRKRRSWGSPPAPPIAHGPARQSRKTVGSPRRFRLASPGQGGTRGMTRPQPEAPKAPRLADEVRKTTCYMCACRCGIDVHVKDGRVTYIEGNRDHPVNRASSAPRARPASSRSPLPPASGRRSAASARAAQAPSRRSPGTRRSKPPSPGSGHCGPPPPNGSPSSPAATSRSPSPAGGRRPSARPTTPRTADSARSTWRRRHLHDRRRLLGVRPARLGQDRALPPLRRGRGPRFEPDQDRHRQAQGARRPRDRREPDPHRLQRRGRRLVRHHAGYGRAPDPVARPLPPEGREDRRRLPRALDERALPRGRRP